MIGVTKLVSAEEYLADEEDSLVKREYVDGRIYSKAPERNLHNLIVGNVLVAFQMRLPGSRCRPWNSDTKIRIQAATKARFYYPDTSVVCRPNPLTDSFQDEPVIVVEILSRKTRRIDEGEKCEAYLTIPSLAAYLLVEQETAGVVVFRRGQRGFDREVYSGEDAVIPLPELGIELPFSEIYDGAEFAPEEEDPPEWA